MCAGNQSSKNQHMEGEIWIVQSIQLCFLLSLGSATSNEANRRVMWHSEWTITARQVVTVLCLAQMKDRCFDPERCKQNAIFQVQAIKTGHISVMYRQTGGVLSVGSTGFAASW